MAEAGNCRQSTLLSTKESRERNRSGERVSPHSIDAKSQDMILSRLQRGGLPLSISHLALSKHGKSLSICTNELGEKKSTLETPAFSQRDSNTPKIDLPDEVLLPIHRQSQISNKQVYQLLESIKIMPVRNGKKEQLVRTIREGLVHLQDQPELRPQVQSMEGILTKIECKLKNEPYNSATSIRKQQPPLSLSEISPIRKLSPPKSSKVLYTNLNLQMFCEDGCKESSANRPMEEQHSNVDNIQYYKIMHMLGQKYEITPKKSERCSQRRRQSTDRKEDLSESIRISQLNLQLEMLENMLQSKRKLTSASKPPSAQSKSVRDLLSMKRKTLNLKENSNVQSRMSGRKLSRAYY